MDVARTAIRHGTEYLTCFSITKEVAHSKVVAEAMHKYMQSLKEEESKDE